MHIFAENTGSMKNRLFLTIIAALLLAGCGQKSTQQSFTEEEALDFLYEYMPLGDNVDYSREYYRECVQYAFKAKLEMPWGSNIPEREFKHFVLPPRVNNENLDRFRATYYEELKARVQGLTLYDAVLEVNHWCHEHVSYRGSDSRTSAPMATVKTSWGRCGEESTLLVTALRTVGIPARQVYTPRWAHCDDNHAWVEAWADGKWHFLGACEPEPVLDLGWFNEPASRALLLHTRVFGDYDGPEEVISRNDFYTEINVVDNYAKTAKTTFTVLDTEGVPQPGIEVEFKIYNYAEFCTVVRKTTDENGQTWLTSGLGCMMAYAAKDGMFGFQVFKGGEQDQVTITLDHQEGTVDSFEFDMVPPAPSSLSPEVTAEMRAENDRRVKYEDSIRNAYIADCKKAQQEIIANTGNKTLCSIYEKTWGNYQTIADFVKYAQEQGKEVEAVMLLQTLSDKDLRDITYEALMDHFTPLVIARTASVAWQDEAIHVISPRISNEMIVPWRKAFSTLFSEEEAQQFHDNPAQLVEWTRQTISINNEANPQRIPISPSGVLKAMVADRHSRDIFFVAMARCLGIPAQINPVTGKVQYVIASEAKQSTLDNNWIDVDFEAEQPAIAKTGYLDLQYEPIAAVGDPKYYTHFSIKKFDGNSFKLLAYDAKDPGIDDGLTLSTFDHPTPLDEGYYILTSGTRLNDGTALTHSEFFTIKAGETTKVKLVLREQQNELQVIGHFEAGDLIQGVEGYYILGLLDQGSEPTTHALQDIATFQKEFDERDIPIIYFNDNQQGFDGYRQSLVDSLQLDKTMLPIFIIGNTNSEVYFVKQGYTIGLGEQLLKVQVH